MIGFVGGGGSTLFNLDFIGVVRHGETHKNGVVRHRKRNRRAGFGIVVNDTADIYLFAVIKSNAGISATRTLVQSEGLPLQVGARDKIGRSESGVVGSRAILTVHNHAALQRVRCGIVEIFAGKSNGNDILVTVQVPDTAVSSVNTVISKPVTIGNKGQRQ